MTRGFVWTILALAILTAFPVNSFAIKIATVDMATIYKNYQEVRKSQAFLKEKNWLYKISKRIFAKTRVNTLRTW